jgi:hypothetical protein
MAFCILNCMSKGDPVPPLPADAPKAGEVYKHYKGDLYKVVLLAEHSNDNEWMVVYEPQYENPDAPYFTRPLREWSEPVEWEGNRVLRFTKI